MELLLQVKSVPEVDDTEEMKMQKIAAKWLKQNLAKANIKRYTVWAKSGSRISRTVAVIN
jgi:riboflavin synthase